MRRSVIYSYEKNEFYIIPTSDIVFDEPLYNAVSAPNDRDAAYQVGDYSLVNIDSDAPNDMREAGVKLFGEDFRDLEITIESYGDEVELDNLYEIDLEDKEDEIREFIKKWCEDNEVIVTGTYFRWWDGSNYDYIILDSDNSDCMPATFRILDDDEAAPILKAYEDAKFEETSVGIREADSNGYHLVKSQWEKEIEKGIYGYPIKK